ncbi:MAG: hypothetical protein ACREDR_17595 [Blastocatellia bacterium]
MLDLRRLHYFEPGVQVALSLEVSNRLTLGYELCYTFSGKNRDESTRRRQPILPICQLKDFQLVCPIMPNLRYVERCVDFKLPRGLTRKIDLDDDIGGRIRGQIKSVLTDYRGGCGKVEAIVGLAPLPKGRFLSVTEPRLSVSTSSS